MCCFRKKDVKKKGFSINSALKNVLDKVSFTEEQLKEIKRILFKDNEKT